MSVINGGFVLWDLPSLVIDLDPEFSINSSGELSARWLGEGRSISGLPLLYTEDGEFVRPANLWLIDLKANGELKQVNTQAQGLLHYFSFLADLSLSWQDMPIVQRDRPTYLFKRHLKDLFKQGGISRSTANSYMRVVVNFYTFYLRQGKKFENRPFDYETVKIQLPGSHTSMSRDEIHVSSTDLRLRLPKDTTHNGVSRELIPLSDEEWSLVDSICRIQGRAVSLIEGNEKLVSISEEFKIAVLLAKYTGMRREEITTFRESLIFKPSNGQLEKKYLIDSDGVYISPQAGVKTKFGSSRTIEIPSALMLVLHKYTNSKRYLQRRKKYMEMHPEDKYGPPLLINQTGRMFSSRSFNARWGEVRNSARKESKGFNHKFHNLRPTYAVSRLTEMLKSGNVNESDALDYLQSVMGHQQRSTLLSYLSFAKRDEDVNEIYEEAIDVILGDKNEYRLDG